jgi:hypothetical protein
MVLICALFLRGRGGLALKGGELALNAFGAYQNVQAAAQPKKREPKGRGGSSLGKINTAINAAGVAVDAVNAGAAVAGAVKGKREPKYVLFPSSSICMILICILSLRGRGGLALKAGELALNAFGAAQNVQAAAQPKKREPKGRGGSSLGKINTAINAAGVAVDAVNAGAAVAGAVKGKREPKYVLFPSSSMCVILICILSLRGRGGLALKAGELALNAFGAAQNVQAAAQPKKREPKGRGGSSLGKINTAINAAGVAVDAVNAGAAVAGAVKGKREPKGRGGSRPGKINTAINAAGVAVDAVNAGAAVAGAVQGKRELEFEWEELAAREPKGRGGSRLGKINTAINGAGVAVDAVNAGAAVAGAVQGKRELEFEWEELVAREPKGRGGSRLGKINTAINAAGVAVDAVNAGAAVAGAAQGKRELEFEWEELAAREPKGRGGSQTLNRINTAIKGAGVAVDAVNAGAAVATAAQGKRELDFEFEELAARGFDWADLDELD